MRGKQSFKKVFGTLEGKKDIENKEERDFQQDFYQSAAEPILGEVAKLILRKIFGGRKTRR